MTLWVGVRSSNNTPALRQANPCLQMRAKILRDIATIARLSALGVIKLDVAEAECWAIDVLKRSVDPPPLNWSTAYDRQRRIKDGNETT